MNEPASSEVKLQVRYSAPDGSPALLELRDTPITVGRSPDADIITLDERASRMHCGIRLWDGEYYIKDLKSKNGTFLNSDRVEMAKIKPGDKIRIGNTVLSIEDGSKPGTNTSLSNVQDEMNEGKGYKTILREIVEDVEQPAGSVQEAAPANGAGVSEASDATETKTEQKVDPAPSAPKAESALIEPKTKTAKLSTPRTDKLPKVTGKKKGPTAIRAGAGKRPATIKIKRK